MSAGYVSARDVVRAAESQNRWIQAEVARLDTLERDHRARQAEQDQALEDAWSNLVDTLLPSLAGPVLDDASRLLSLAEISSAAVAKRRQDEQSRATARLAAIHADPRFTERAERLTVVSIRVTEIDEYKQPLEESVRALEEEPLFVALVREGYGTDAYTSSWWRLSYFRHWKHADLVVEKHGPRLGATEFGAIRERYLEELRALEAFLAERKELMATAKAITDLEDEEARWQQALQALDGNLLASARAKVRAHLEALPAEERIVLLLPRPDLVIAAKRVAGVEAKRKYLEAMREEQLRRWRADLMRMQDKNRRDIVKLSRPKHQGRAFPRADYDRRFQDRAAKMEKRYQRYLDARDRIVVFEDYDRWGGRDLLWWDVMTDGRIDGDFIPEVREHHLHHAHHAHAEVSYARDAFDDAAFSDVS